jgi:FkbM family methyltransferase
VPVEPLIPILFPNGLDAAQREAVATLAPDGMVTDASDIRRILAGLDAYTAPSTFSVRATRADLTVWSFDGTEVVLDQADASISRLLLLGHPYEPHLRRVLRAFVTPGDTVVDVGANLGIHTILCAQLVGPSGHVVAVEANPENCRLILLSVERNQLTNVRLVPLALGPTAGHCFFGPALGSNGGVRPDGSSRLWDGYDALVPTTRLDDLGLNRLDLLKIDVEGAEHGVVIGGAATIDAHRPVVITEFSQEMTARVSGVEPASFLRWFEERGYQLGLVERDTAVVRPQTIDELLAGWGDPLRIEDLLWWPSERSLPADLLEPPAS